MGHRKSWLSVLVQRYQRLRQAIAEAPPVAAIPAILFGIAAAVIYGVGELILASVHTDPAVRTIIKVTVDAVAVGIGFCCFLFLALGIVLGAQRLGSGWQEERIKQQKKKEAHKLEIQRLRAERARLKTEEKRQRLQQNQDRTRSRNSQKLEDEITKKKIWFLRKAQVEDVMNLEGSYNGMQRSLPAEVKVVEVEATRSVSEGQRIVDAD